MDNGKSFTNNDLLQLSKSRYTMIEQAVRNGDKKEALKKLGELREESMMIHDMFRDWITDTFSRIANRFGNKVVSDIMLETMENLINPLNELFKAGFRECVKTTAAIWRSHFSEFELVEDDEKVTFILKPCGSGGKQIEDGKYNKTSGFVRISEAQPLTGGHTNCPIYCTHCFCMTKIMLMQGMPFIYVAEKKNGQHTGNCIFHIYKSPSKVPKKVCREVGQEMMFLLPKTGTISQDDNREGVSSVGT